MHQVEFANIDQHTRREGQSTSPEPQGLPNSWPKSAGATTRPTGPGALPDKGAGRDALTACGATPTATDRGLGGELRAGGAATVLSGALPDTPGAGDGGDGSGSSRLKGVK